MRRQHAFGVASFTTLGLALAVLPVTAATFTEQGDAGSIPDFAQAVGAGIDEIWGSLSGDQDLFSFRWDGGIFSATTDWPQTNFDTQLFLFDADGFGIVGNDDNASNGGIANTPFPSTITPFTLAAGDYFLGISAYNSEPTSSGGTIFSPTGWPYSAQVTPTGPGGDEPLSGWTNNYYRSGDYRIVLSEETVAVPESRSSVPLLGLGIVVVAGTALKRKLTKLI